MDINIHELEELKNHLAECLAAGIDKQISPIVTKVDGAVAMVNSMEARITAHATEISKLKATQAKALAVWTLMITAIGAGVTFGFNYIWTWLKTHVHFGG